MEMNEKLVRELKKKFEMEMGKKEAEIVEYWKGQIEVIYKKRYESMSSMQVDIRGLVERMNNRLAILNRMVREGM